MKKAPDRSQFSVRKLTSRYYDAVVSIDRECADSFWNREDFKNQCNKDDSSILVLLHKSTPVGFVAYEYMKEDGEIHILNMGLRSKYRRMKLGTMLLDRVKLKMKNSYKLLQLVVRETNYTAQLFLKNNGFRARLVRNYFVDYLQNRTIREDGYCFEYHKEITNTETSYSCSKATNSSGFVSYDTRELKRRLAGNKANP